MPYWQLIYHITWATKDREPLLTEQIENDAHERIRVQAIKLGAMVHAVNGMADHIHLIASVPPTVQLSTFVGQVKGAVSATINRDHPNQRLQWQPSYAIFSLDAKRLPHHVAYVQRQKAHHADQTIFPVLERDGWDGKASGG